MAIFKCKMCGGALEVNDGTTVCECEYCGTTQTLPKTDNEQTINMLNRASHFRQQCEFDKAMEIYEKLLDSSDKDSEIYWQIVLCRYGIEYVDDPLTKKKIPTCHRTQFKSILDNADYLEALEHADSIQKDLYIKEAEYIDSVQKGILEISNKEEPFDVFICYKESDDNGKRTHDSVLAQDLYYQLEREGFKVFFSRITLEGKLGTAYEPYIFAALNSAKVMVVVGTKPEYFNAVWVKNEWSRYLMLMQNDRSKTIIPAYKDMDPYDLPDALSMFQAQDMSKLGFMQDLIRGIKKLTNSEKKKKVTFNENKSNSDKIQPLLKRAYIFLEDGEWKEADEYCEKVLDIDPECAEAYLGKMMAEMKISKKEKIPDAAFYGKSSNYIKMIRYADYNLKKEMISYNKRWLYNWAEHIRMNGKSKNEILKAEAIFLYLDDFLDSEIKVEECEKHLMVISKAETKIKDEITRKEEILKNAIEAINFSALSDSDVVKKDLEKSIYELSAIRGYKNADSLLIDCKNKLKILNVKTAKATTFLDKLFEIIDEYRFHLGFGIFIVVIIILIIKR